MAKIQTILETNIIPINSCVVFCFVLCFGGGCGFVWFLWFFFLEVCVMLFVKGGEFYHIS